MKTSVHLLFALAGVVGFALPHQASKRATMILYGDNRGYLSPCGCTQPMSGGITRAGAFIRGLQQEGDTVFLVNGNLVGARSRQSELKAETLAETFKNLNAAAIHYTSSEAALGMGTLLSMSQLSDRRLISTTIRPPDSGDLMPLTVSGPFAIAGVSEKAALGASAIDAQAQPEKDAIDQLLKEAKRGNLWPVVLLEGDRDDAVKLANAYPDLKLIVYQTTGDPPAQATHIGTTSLVTTGKQGKYVIAVKFENGVFKDYSREKLDPEHKDDPAILDIYKRYLKRVEDEDLLGQVAKFPTADYAGSKSCESCHRASYAIWEKSKHHVALHTLETESHGRDPDCVGCHVVALDSTKGFISREKTPDLANVGCESCHGPSAAHVKSPYKAKLPKVGEKVCLTCHTLENSPKFDFKTYWPKIRHK